MNKRLRFEVFKRDQFQCQYCGRTPPGVTLELDHILPKSKGGKEHISNYITACLDCNRGKGSINLSVIPQSLQATMDTLKERQKQVKAYTRYLEKVAKEIETSVNAINDEFTSFFPGYELTDHFKARTVKKFVQLLPVMKVVDAMQLACLKMMDEAVPDEEKGGRAIEYFCGICWNWIKRPETREW